MQTFLLYMIKSSTILIVLLTYYQFFLKRQTFFNLNRIFLLGVLVLSALLPFISIEINRNDMIGFPTLASVSELLEENQIGKSSQSTLITATEQPIPMIPLLYGIGVVFFFLRYLTTLCRLCLFVHRNPRKRLHGLYMIQIQEGLPTFSFFNYLFINPHSLSQENRRKNICTRKNSHTTMPQSGFVYSRDHLHRQLVQSFCVVNKTAYSRKPRIYRRSTGYP